MKFNSFYSLYIIFIIFLIFSLCFFIPIFSKYGYVSTYLPTNSTLDINISYSNFVWPTPGYTTITSKFGYRTAPTTGAGIYHGGIDIAAPAGSNIISVSSGIVKSIGFKGANGYTVTIENGLYIFSYSHISPNFLVTKEQLISKGQVIATVGPKNVYNVPNNPYKDSNGNPTNRRHYWTTFAFFNKKRRQSRQSFRLFLEFITYLLHHFLHDYNESNFLHNNRHVHRSYLPNLILFHYYTQGIPLHSLTHHIPLKIHYCSMDKL